MALLTQTHLGEHEFHGPHLNSGTLPARSGVYLITQLVNGAHRVIDVGESHNILQRVPNHDRMKHWHRVSAGVFHVWTLLADEPQRMLIEKAHRQVYKPICGVR